jgi:hypothetical protein
MGFLGIRLGPFQYSLHRFLNTKSKGRDIAEGRPLPAHSPTLAAHEFKKKKKNPCRPFSR